MASGQTTERWAVLFALCEYGSIVEGKAYITTLFRAWMLCRASVLPNTKKKKHNRLNL